MDAYRDQYAKLFNGGQGVKLLAVSVDSDTALASWARDRKYPFTFLSDAGGEVGRRYGAFDTEHKVDDRTLYVIGPDGTIAYRAAPFEELDATAYPALAEGIRKANGGAGATRERKEPHE